MGKGQYGWKAQHKRQHDTTRHTKHHGKQWLYVLGATKEKAGVLTWRRCVMRRLRLSRCHGDDGDDGDDDDDIGLIVMYVGEEI
jgi:hypothetical protein